MEDFTTIIIGNGLGMALDKDYFPIDAGLKYAWELLNLDTKHKIKQLMTEGDELVTEKQLDKHYEAIQACSTLIRLEINDLKWLQEDARGLPIKFYHFIEKVAWYFFEDKINILHPKKTELNKFLMELKKYILNRGCLQFGVIG